MRAFALRGTKLTKPWKFVNFVEGQMKDRKSYSERIVKPALGKTEGKEIGFAL